MKFLSTILFFLSIQTLLGQDYKISPDIIIKNDFAYYILHLEKNNIALIRDKSFRLVLQILHENFEWSTEIDLPLKGKKWRLIEIFNDRGNIGIFYAAKMENETLMLYEKYSTNGQLLSSKYLNKTNDFNLQSGFKLQSSQDENWFAIGYKDLSSEKKLLLYNRDQDSVYYSIVLKNQLNYQESSVSDLELSNKGTAYFFGLAKNHPTNKRRAWYMMSSLAADGKSVNTQGFDLPDHELYDGMMLYNNFTENLTLAGLYSEKSSSVPRGYLHTQWSQTGNWNGIIRNEFSESLLKEWSGRQKKSSVSNAELQTRHITFDKTGGFQVFYENSKELSRRPYFSSGLDAGTSSYNRWVDYYFDDIIVACISSDTLKWDAVLHKKQYSQDDDAVFSSFFLLKNNAFLRLIFNDEIRNEGTASEYILRADGNFIRKSLLNTSYKNLNLRFIDAIALDASTLLVPSENAGKLNLVKIFL